MTTRRTLLSQAAFGAAALVSAIGVTRLPALAANGNGNGNNNTLQRRRRERRRNRRERRRDRRDND